MPNFTAKDGSDIYFKDWGSGQAVVFSHGWPLNSDAFEDQMFFLATHGYRVLAHDRRGHGRSSQTWLGNDLNTYADDLAEMFRLLNLTDIILVGHSTGAGDVARYIGRHGSSRLAKAVLISSISPVLMKCEQNTAGIPIETLNDIRATILACRSAYFRELATRYYGLNRKGAKVPKEIIDSFWFQCMQTGLPASYLSIKAFSETDLTDDLKKFDLPTLLLHGDDDQIVPISSATFLTAKILQNSETIIYPGGSHGICTTEKSRVNSDLLRFILA